MPDIVLLDVRMPGLSGNELGDLLVKNGAAVIFHSGEDARVLEEHAEGVGALGYIVKSEDGARFLLEFEKLVSKHRELRVG